MSWTIAPAEMPASPSFDPRVLDRAVIALPLQQDMLARGVETLFDIVIDLNLNFPGGRDRARERVRDLAAAALAATAPNTGDRAADAGVDQRKTELSDQYVFARLTGSAIRALVRLDAQSVGGASSAAGRVIYRIWPDFQIRALLTHSVSTVKSDAAFTSFSAAGKNIVWAVLDSGVQGDHPHFRKHGTLNLAAPLRHRDFTAAPGAPETPLVDEFGHGTHVAGIIAGELEPSDLIDPGATAAATAAPPAITAIARHRDESGNVVHELVPIDKIRGVAPQCQIVSVKVLDRTGSGQVSNLITALEEIGRVNGYGKDLRIHGVNLSVGYDFDPEWF
ncbi:MAG: S8 family serine peptidase, partial [Gemmatimonadaceae bacterium]